MSKGRNIFILVLLFIICQKLQAQVGTLTGWGMAVCNTYSFNICPNQTITPTSYGTQGWVCNNSTMADVSFNIMGPSWRVARHNYTFTANTNGQITGFNPSGSPQSLTFLSGQSIIPFSYVTISSVSCVIFAINGNPTTYTFSQNTFSISILPLIFSGNNYTLCSNTNSSVTISPVIPTQGGPWTFQWQPGNLSGNPVTVNPAISTIYTVTATGSSNCTNTVTIAVTVTNCCTPPTLSVSGSATNICAGSSTSLSVSGATTYTWNPGNITGSVITVTPSVSTIYTVIASAGTGCAANKTISIIVTPVPTLNISASSNAICSGNSCTLTATGATNYLWTPGALTTAVIVISPTTNITYSLVGLNGACTDSKTSLVTVNPLPVINVINSASVICAGNSVTLSASGAQSYNWVPGSLSGGSIIITPSVTTLYTITGTNGFGCDATKTLQVIANPLPIVTSTTLKLCIGENINLIANGGYSYSWVGPLGFNSGLQNPVILNAQLNMSGTYSLVSSTSAGCSAFAITNVLISTVPQLTVVQNSTLCAGSSITLNAAAAAGSNYTWSGPGGFNSILQSPVIPNAQANASGIYTVNVSVNSSCSGIAQVSVSIRPLPVITVSGNTNGCVPFCINLNSQSTVPLQSLFWQYGNGSNALAITAVSSCYTLQGTYTILSSYTDIYGCANKSNFYVNVYPKPIADFEYTPQRPIENEPVTFIETSYCTNINNHNWYFTDTVFTQQTISYSYSVTGNYAVALVIKNSYGCSDTAVKEIKVMEDFEIYIPNAFTPNGDGLNDVFQPKGHGIIKYELTLFDRWGEKLFSTTNFNEGWNGTRKGNDILQQDIYTWKIALTTTLGKSKDYTGNVTLEK